MSGSPTKQATSASASSPAAASTAGNKSSPATSSPIKATSAATAASSSSSTAAPTTATDATALGAHADYLSTLATLLDEANLAFGQRNFEHSAMLFSQVAEAYAREFGTVHPKCADVHFRYGRALLNHAIERSGILGDAEQVKNATGKREKDLLSLVDDSLIPVKDPSRFHFSEDSAALGDDDMDADPEEQQEDIGEDDGGEDAGEGDEGEEHDEAGHDQEQDEDIEDDDFEIAFEVLDVARVIYEKMLSGDLPLDATGLPDPSPAAATFPSSSKGKAKAATPSLSSDDLARLAVKRRYAEVVATLADVSLESESFGQAVEDYSQALVLQSELYAPTDRRLAETHYKLALALEYAESPELDRALEHLHASRKVLVARRDELADILDKGTAAGEADVHKSKLEVAEIQDLLPELDLKVEDVKQAIYARDHPEEATGSSSAADQAAGNKAAGDNVQVNDLSGLVKKKSTAAPSAPPAASSSSAASAGSPSKKRKLDQVEQEKTESGEKSPKKAKLDG